MHSQNNYSCLISSLLTFAMVLILQTNQNCARGERFPGGRIGIAFSTYSHPSYKENFYDVKAKMELISKQFNKVYSFGSLARKGRKNIHNLFT